MDFMPSLVIQPGQVYPQPQQPYGQQQAYEDSFSGSQSVGSVGPHDNRVLQARNPDTFVQDSSATFNTSGLAAGPSSSTSSPTPIDGKGRLLDTRGEKVPMVHLDGGAFNESSSSAPPAYRE